MQADEENQNLMVYVNTLLPCDILINIGYQTSIPWTNSYLLCETNYSEYLIEIEESSFNKIPLN